MKMAHGRVFASVIFLIGHLVQSANGGVTVTIQDVAVVGNSVTLVCTYAPVTDRQSFGNMKWQRKDTVLAMRSCDPICTSREENHSKYSLTVDYISTGNLTINELQSSDSGNYSCFVVKENGLSSASKMLEVKPLVPPHDIQLDAEGYTKHTHSGMTGVNVFTRTEVSFVCKCLQSRPAASISWNLGEERLPGGNLTSSWNMAPDVILANSQSIIKITLTPDNHYKALRCSATVGRTRNTTELYLFVQGLPDGLMIEGLEDVISGRPHVVTCKANNGYPAPMIHWFLGTRNVTFKASLHIQTNSAGRVNATSQLSFTPSSSDNGESILCKAVVPMSQSIRREINVSSLLTVDTPRFDIIIDENLTTSSSLFVAWQPKGHSLKRHTYRVKVCENDSMWQENNCETRVTGTNNSLKWTELNSFTWYSVSVETEGNNWRGESTPVVTSTAPKSPFEYGISVVLDQDRETLTLSDLPENKTIPEEICFVVRNTSYFLCQTNASHECRQPGSKFKVETASGYVLVLSYGRGMCSDPTISTLRGEQPVNRLSDLLVISGPIVVATVLVMFASSALCVIFRSRTCCGETRNAKTEITTRDSHNDIPLETNGRMVDDDGLVYISLSHDNTHPHRAPPIRKEQLTVYADISSMRELN